MTMTLGQIITRLESKDSAAHVQFDFCNFVPGELLSYRGYYDHLAISPIEDAASPTVAEVLRRLRAANGATFTGYKGGEFRMSEHTPVWVARYGRSTSTAVVGLMETSWELVIIETGYEP